MNLLAPKDRTKVPINEHITYSTAVIDTVARAVADLVCNQNSAALPMLVQEVKDRLDPWTPMHPTEGRMSKRIPDMTFKAFGVNMSSGLVSALSNYLGQDVPNNGFEYDISDQFEWEDGDYGDKNSCFFHDPFIFHLLKDEGAVALRFYSPEGKGSSRALVMPSGYDGMPMVFNAYGLNLQQVANRIKGMTNGEARLKMVEAILPSPLVVNMSVAILVSQTNDEQWVEVPVSPRINTSKGRNIACHHCGEQTKYSLMIADGRRRLCLKCGEEFVDIDIVDKRGYPKGSLADTRVCGRLVPGTTRYAGEESAKVHYANLPVMRRCAIGDHFIYPSNDRENEAVVLRNRRHEIVCHPCRESEGLLAKCLTCGVYNKPGRRCTCRT